MTVMLTLRFLVRLWFKSLSGSLLIILHYNRTRNWSVNITVMPKKNKQTKKTNKHYLDVFWLMSNLPITCVDVCQRSRIVTTTYYQRSRTCEPYVEYVVKFSACLKFHDVRDVPRNMTAYFIVFQRALNVLLRISPARRANGHSL